MTSWRAWCVWWGTTANSSSTTCSPCIWHAASTRSGRRAVCCTRHPSASLHLLLLDARACYTCTHIVPGEGPYTRFGTLAHGYADVKSPGVRWLLCIDDCRTG